MPFCHCFNSLSFSHLLCVPKFENEHILCLCKIMRIRRADACTAVGESAANIERKSRGRDVKEAVSATPASLREHAYILCGKWLRADFLLSGLNSLLQRVSLSLSLSLFPCLSFTVTKRHEYFPLEPEPTRIFTNVDSHNPYLYNISV